MTPRRTRIRLERLDSRDNPSIYFHFDYSLDSTGFFNDPARRAALEQAGFALTNQLNDSLDAVTPGGVNSWSVTMPNPVTGQPFTKSNLSIDADAIVVYAAGAPLAGDLLGTTQATTYTATGTAGWLHTVQRRGEALGDFAPWGGEVSFDSGTNWNFAESRPNANQYDFRSVAQHELMHILGFGAGNPAFERSVSGSQYIGANVVAIAGGPVAVVGDAEHGNHPDHWAPGTTIYGVAPVMSPDLQPGQQRLVTAIDLAALADLGWNVDLVTSVFTPTSPPTSNTGTPVGTSPTGEPLFTETQNPSPFIPASSTSGPLAVAVGAGEGSAPTITGYDAAGHKIFTRTVFDSTMTGGVRVAVADFNGDGTLDLAVGTGVGFTSKVRILNGATGSELFSLSPFERGFTGGVFLAAGDVTGDGRADLVVSAGTGGGPRVRVFGYSNFTQLADFFTIEDANFRGGVRPTLADFTGDGRADLLVAAGIGGGPRVAAYDGVSLTPNVAPRKFVNDFYAGDPAVSDGAYLATGDTNGDGVPDLVASSGPTVTVYDGKELGRFHRTTTNATFAPPTADSRSGARIAVADVSGDGKGDVITFATFRTTARQTAAYSPITKQLLPFEI